MTHKVYCKVCRMDDDFLDYYIKQNKKAGLECLPGYDQFYMKEGKRRSRVVLLDQYPTRDLQDYFLYVEVCNNEPYRSPTAVFDRLESGKYRFSNEPNKARF